MVEQSQNKLNTSDNTTPEKAPPKEHEAISTFVRDLYSPGDKPNTTQKENIPKAVGAGDVFSSDNLKTSELYGRDDKTQRLKASDQSSSNEFSFQGTSIESERNRVIEDISRSEKNPAAIEKAKANMQKFEQQAREGNVSQDNVEQTYRHLGTLLETESKVPNLTADNRKMLAEDFLSDAAQPKSITQGEHNTCAVTAIGKKLMMTDPARAASIVSTMALEGNYVASDGKPIGAIPSSLLPFHEEQSHHEKSDSGRSYATQMLNIGLANDALQRRTPADWYFQVEPTNMLDTGERVISQDGHYEGKRMWDGSAQPADHPGLSDSEITQVLQRQTNDNQTILSGKARVDEVLKDDAEAKKDPTFDYGHEHAQDLTPIDSTDTLSKQLISLQKAGKLPAIIGVDYSNPAFAKGRAAGEKGEWHALLVSKINEQTGEVEVVDSEPGAPPVRSMSVAALYGAMSETGTK